MKFSFLKKETSPEQKRNIKRTNIIELAATILIIVFVNIIGFYFFTRFDLTAEKRYTLSPSTKKLLKNLDDVAYFKVYLEGDFPADFKRLRNETREMLNQFRAYSKYIEYEFVNINEVASTKEERNEMYQRLYDKGLRPTQLRVPNKDGGLTELYIFPCAEVIYKGREKPVQLLINQRFSNNDNILNNSIQSLEYSLTDVIRRLTTSHKERIGFLRGHGELEGEDIVDIKVALMDYYNVEEATIDEKIYSLTYRDTDPKDSTKYTFRNKYKALVIPKPSKPFSDKDLFILDQYLMRGGKILWLIDPLYVSMDSIQNTKSTIAYTQPLHLENILFRYGIRINTNLVLDINCVPIPLHTSTVGDKPGFSFAPWYYFPEIVPLSDHPIVKNVNSIKTEFVSSIDTLESPVKKTILLTTSKFSRILYAPVEVNLEEAVKEPQERLYNKKYVPVSVLLEGVFESAFKHRLPAELTEAPEMGFLNESSPTKMIVVGDGDVIKNQFNYKYGYPYPLGFDRYTGETYGNKNFILNCINYLCDDQDFLSTRSREIKIRKLDALKIKKDETLYQILNVALPVALIAVFGVILFFVRRRLYTK